MALNQIFTCHLSDRKQNDDGDQMTNRPLVGRQKRRRDRVFPPWVQGLPPGIIAYLLNYLNTRECNRIIIVSNQLREIIRQVCTPFGICMTLPISLDCFIIEATDFGVSFHQRTYFIFFVFITYCKEL